MPSSCLPLYLQEYANDLLILFTAPVDPRSSLLPSNDLGGGPDTASKRPQRSQSAALGPRGTFCVLHCPFVFIHSMRSTRVDSRTSHTRASERAQLRCCTMCAHDERNRRSYVMSLKSYKANRILRKLELKLVYLGYLKDNFSRNQKLLHDICIMVVLPLISCCFQLESKSIFFIFICIG